MTLKSQIPITQKYSGTEHSFYTFRSQSNDPLPLTSYTPNIMLHINASNITTYGSIVPSSCNVYDLGSSNYRFRDLYLSGNTIDLGGTRISRDSSTGGMKITSLTTNEPVDIQAKHVYVSSNVFTSNVVVYGNIQFNNVSLKNNVQVTPVRQVFYTQENQTVFTLSTSGIYGGHASNVQIFQGSSLLSYYTSNQTDYSLSLLYNQNPPTTVYTVTLTQGIPYGTYVDITVWPTLLPESTPQGFLYQNVVLDATSFTTFATQGSSIYYNNGNVGIGTNVPTSKLDVRGTIVCSNIQVIGDFVTLNTVTSNTEQIVVENAGTGPALKVTQTGNNSVAEFYDKESGVALYVGNGGNVGVGTTIPLQSLDINGSMVVRGNIGIGTTILSQPFHLVSQGNSVVMDSRGNVGVGTNSPTQKIHINGYARFNHPAFCATRTSANVSGTTIIVWNNVLLNIGSCYNSTNGYFTAPVRGVYIFQCHAMKVASTSYMYLHIYKNDISQTCGHSGSSPYDHATANTMIELQVNDYVYVQHRGDELYGTSDATATNGYNSFTGHLLYAL